MPPAQRSKHDREQPERYEPLPPLPELPRWIWRRMGRTSRLAAGLALLAAVAIAVALIPVIGSSKQERARDEQRERAERRADLVRRLRAEQRPRFGRSDALAPPNAVAPRQLAARATLMEELRAAMLLDARERVRRDELEGPVRRVECDPYPPSVDDVGAHEQLSRRRGRYACVAVTAQFERSEASVGGLIGHPYRVLVDFESGRYAFCKISGQAGPSKEQLVTTPRACGGR